MNILEWLGLRQSKQEAERLHRFEYGLREVERWTQARIAIAEHGQEMTRRFQQEINQHAQKWGTQGEGMKALRWNMEGFQEQNERHLQEADQRLTIYRNIVLMKGRI